MTLKVIARANVDPPAQAPTQSISAKSMKSLTKKQSEQPLNTKAKNFTAATAHEAVLTEISSIQRNTVNSYGFGGATRPADPNLPKQNQVTFPIRDFLFQRYGEDPSNEVPLNNPASLARQRVEASSLNSMLAGRHIERGPWYRNKGALYLFHGTEGPGSNEPYMAMYFQKYPTEVSYSRTSNIAEQNIAGQTGTSLQNLGSTSTKISTELFFHDAWIEKEQVTTSEGLTQLNAIIKLGWKYKLFFQVGTNSPIPVVLNSLKVVMSHFTASGLIDKDNVRLGHKQPAGQNYFETLHPKMRAIAPDVPQHARVTVEMTVDESKDVVVPFVKRAPVRRPSKKPEAKQCFTPQEIKSLQETAITEGIAAGQLYSADQTTDLMVQASYVEFPEGMAPDEFSESR